MTLYWKQVTDYDNQLYQTLSKFEATHLTPKLIGGNITIGLGFDMDRGGKVIRDAVLAKMGIGTADPYYNQLTTALKGNSISAVNTIMTNRAADNEIEAAPGETLRSSFEFKDLDEVKSVFAQWEVQDVYLKRLTDIYPAARTDSDFKTSSESIALFSLVWNGAGGQLKANLKSAIAEGDRAEAWYLIRNEANYIGKKLSLGIALTDNSGTTQDEQGYFEQGIDIGWAKRRYYEAELFGLYDDPTNVGQTEATSVYAMFTKHREQIEAYEALYGIDFDGTLGVRKTNGLPPLIAAGRDYDLDPSQTPNSLDNELFPALQVLRQAGILVVPNLQTFDTATVQGYQNITTADLYQEYKQAVPGFQPGDKVWEWGDSQDQLVLRANGEAEHWQKISGDWTLATRQSAPNRTWTIVQSDATRIDYELFADSEWRLTHTDNTGQILDVTESTRGGWIKTDANNRVLDGYYPNSRHILGITTGAASLPDAYVAEWASAQYVSETSYLIDGLDYRLDPTSGLLYRDLGQNQYDLFDPVTGTRSLEATDGTITPVSDGQALAFNEAGLYRVVTTPAQALAHGDEAFDVDTRDGNLYLLNDQRSLGFHANGSLTESTLNTAGQLQMTVERQIDGHAVKIEFVEDEWGELRAANVLSVDGQATATNAFAQVLASQGYDAWGFADGASANSGAAPLAELYHAYDPLKPSGMQTLVSALSRTADALNLLKAIQTGQPLPILASGLRLASTLPNSAEDAAAAGFNLSGTANAVSGVLSLMSLDQALKNGDTIGAITAGAQALSFGANAYVDFTFAQGGGLSTATAIGIDETLNGVPGGAPGVLPFLNIVNCLAHGDTTGAAIYSISMIPGMQWLGIAYTVFNLISSLFGGDDPEPWGAGSWGWNAQGQVVPQVSGGDGGDATLSGLMHQLQGVLTQLADQSGLGLIPERLPGLSFRDNTFHLADIDYASGAEALPELRYTSTGQPFNAPTGSEESYWGLTERFAQVALAHGALAPAWEAETARLQTANHLQDAGLTEADRAAKAGTLAALETDGSQAFRPVVLDLDGDGFSLTARAQSGVAFDVDDTGYLKTTGWLADEGASSDGFLWLDRNWNGAIDSGSELFSNALVQAGSRGVPSLAWVNADGDGRISQADPVWDELKVWQDTNGNGLGEAGEVWGLSGLGIGELDYAHGRFTKDGQTRQLASPELDADTAGSRTHVIAEGILVESTENGISLIATHVDDLSALAVNRDGVTGFEDTELIVGGTDLLANDTLGGVAGSSLTLTSVGNFRNGSGWLDGNGFVHFMPVANFFGSAGFDYAVRASGGQTGTASVEVTVQGVNDAPTLAVNPDLRAIYGYGSAYLDIGIQPWAINLETPYYAPYTGWDYSTATVTNLITISPSYGAHFTPVAWDDPDEHAGSLVVTDLETPAGPFTYTIVGQPQKGGASVNASGQWTYTNWSAPNQPGQQPDSFVDDYARYDRTPDSFRVRVTDSQGASTELDVQVEHIGRYDIPSEGGGDGICPLVVDLDGDSFAFQGVDDSGVFAEVNGDGWKHAIAWSVSDPLLALDENEDGRASLAESTFTRLSPDAQTDLEGLRALDSNADGVIDSRDAKWARLGLWFDRDRSGDDSSQAEFVSLEDVGVASIDLAATRRLEVIDGQSVFARGTIHMQDGTTRQFADTELNWSNTVRIALPDGGTRTATLDPHAAGTLRGGDGDDLIPGQGGDNFIEAGAGDDVVMDDGGDDIVDAGAGSDVVYTGAGDDMVLAGEGDNAVFAGAGSDVVLAGSGHDVVLLEAGNDIAYAGGGDDFVSAGDGNDLLVGNEGDDRLYGESGWDALFGGEGNDELLGMEGDDALYGEAGGDILDGGLGADAMSGGAGDDSYFVDDIADAVTENVNEGSDTVQSTIAYVLGANLENLTLAGTAAINGTGNSADNILTGNSGANTLDGGAGADSMVGGLGDDTYVVDNMSDMVTESAGEGMDTVKSSITRFLEANLENLVLTGTAAINGMGNSADNILTGNNGSNQLIGGDGADTLLGNAGNDYLNGGAGNDWLSGGSGSDFLNGGTGDGDWSDYSDSDQAVTINLALNQASGGHATGDSISDIEGLRGSLYHDSLIGSVGNNGIEGGGGNDFIDGGTGNDTLTGGQGNDTLRGSRGNDVYLFGRGDGSDTWNEFDSTPGNLDIAHFGPDIAHDQIWFRHVGNNLEAQVIGTTDKAIIQNWYLGKVNHIERFEASNGMALLDSQVDALVQAMAAFAPPAAGQTTLPSSYHDALAPVLAANWQ